MDQTVAQTHRTIVQIRAQLVSLANCHQETREDVAMLKAEIAELRFMLDSRTDCIDMYRNHRGIFFYPAFFHKGLSTYGEGSTDDLVM